MATNGVELINSSSLSNGTGGDKLLMSSTISSSTTATATNCKLINSSSSSNCLLFDKTSSFDDLQTINNILLDKIRKRSKQCKAWTDLAKLSRNFLNNDKRLPIINDQQEKLQLQRCLDTIQKSIKVTSLQSMIERLETITRQLGLKFMSINQVDSSDKNVFISSEMFYVEVNLNASGYVIDVKIAHSSDAVSCSELTKVLRDADFVEFNKHLNGLIEIYRLNADKAKKSKAYVALNSLEQDLNLLYRLQSSNINEPNLLVHKSPVGILESRKGGRPMKLTYFISPYDLIDEKRRVSYPLSIEIITEKQLGYSATVCLHNFDKNCYYKLQTVPLISTTRKSDGKNMPINAPLNNSNSISLPACFALKLSESLPISIEIIEKIKQVNNGLDLIYDKDVSSKPQSLISLLARKMLTKKEYDNKFGSPEDPFYVELPDQCHTYYFNRSVSRIEGYEVTSIPFIHPTSVVQILILLRKQVLFNVLIGSCIRQIYCRDELNTNTTTKTTKATINNNNRTDRPLMFEINASITSVNVSFEHPVEESLATIDFDLEEITNIKAKLNDSESFSTYVSDEHVSLVMQRCFSIPVTMRSVIKKCQDKVALLKEELRKKQAQSMQIRPNNDLQSENVNSNTIYNQKQQMLSNEQSERNTTNLINNNNNNYQKHISTTSTNNLQNILQNNNHKINYQQQQQQQYQHTKSNTMLMTMLSDVPAANSLSQVSASHNSNNANKPTSYFIQQQLNTQINNNSNQSTAAAIVQQPKVKKQRKSRKQQVQQDSNTKSPSSYGRSPKRKISEDEYSRDQPTPGSDYMENSYEAYHSGSNQQLSRQSSTASSNSIQYSSIKQDPDMDSSNNCQLLSDLQDQNRNNFNFLDNNSASSSFDFNKRKRSLDNSSDEMKPSFSDLHSQDNFNQTKFSNMTKNYSVNLNSKSPNNGNLNSEKKIVGTLETMLKDTSSSNVPKEKRKRKKIETDSINKNLASSTSSSVMVSNMQLMPPPSKISVTSTNQLTANSPTSSNSSSNYNTYGFVDTLDANNSSIGSPALRPITFNVKPSTMSNLNTGSVSITGVKINEKANKLKQGSPKTTESDSFSMPNYSPKSSPKVSKQTKQAKVINTPTSSLTTVSTSPKSQQQQQQQQQQLQQQQQQQQQSTIKQQSSLKFKSLNTAGSLNTSTSTITKLPTSPISISPPTSASPSSPKTNPLLSSTKLLQTKKNSKGSLNAVIDKLRVNANTSNSDDSSSNSSLSSSTTLTANSLQTTSSGSNVNSIEIAFKTNNNDSQITNKSDIKLTTSPAGSSLSKLNESKIKYNRPEFTVKQSGALKFTVTKTTKSPSVEQTKTKNTNKTPVSTNKNLASSSSSLSSLSTTTNSSLFNQQQKQTSTNKTSTGIKRQLSTTNFKSGIQQNSKNSSTTKSLSPESADQILEAALPKIQLDKLPKIPKTLNSQFNSQQNQQQSSAQSITNAQSSVQQTQNKNNLQAKFLQQQQLKLQQQQNFIKQQMNSYNNLNNNFRKYGTASNQNRTGDQLNQSTDNSGGGQLVRSSTDYCSSTGSITISKTTINNESSHQQQQSSISSSSLNQQQQTENESQNSSKNETIAKSSSISNKQQFIAPNNSNNNNNNNKSTTSTISSTTSSSLTTTANNPTSTPSSPLECNVIPDVYQKSPTIIPTETIEETPRSPSPITNIPVQVMAKTKTVFDLPSTSNTKHSLILENTISKLTDKQQQPSITSFNLTSTNKLLTQSSKVFLEDDDDEERLFIDVSDLNKSKNTSTNSNSSSNTTPSKAIESSPSPIKKRTSLEKTSLTATTIDNTQSNQSSNLMTTTSSITGASTTSSSSSTIPATATTTNLQDSTAHATNTKQSPFSIDDDLMDEALIGSQD